MPLEFGPGSSAAHFFFGTIIDVMLYGLMISQTLEYFLTCKRDRVWLKALAAFLFTIDSFQCAITIANCYLSVIKLPSGMFKLPWHTVCNVIVSTCLVTIVQMFFAYRIKRLSGSTRITSLIITLSLIQTLSGILVAVGAGSKTIPSWYQRVVILWYISNCIPDLIIAMVLVIFLYQRKTGFAGTDTLISRIIRTTIQTGLITALVDITSFVIYLRFPGKTTFLVLTVPYYQLYTNAVMSMLNARQRWEIGTSSGNGCDSTVGELSTVAFEHGVMGTTCTNPAQSLHGHGHGHGHDTHACGFSGKSDIETTAADHHRSHIITNLSRQSFTTTTLSVAHTSSCTDQLTRTPSTLVDEKSLEPEFQMQRKNPDSSLTDLSEKSVPNP